MKDEDIIEAAVRLGEELGLKGSAPLPAVRRALADPDFARALHAVRHMTRERDQMLMAPETARIRRATLDAEELSPSAPSSAKLAAKAAGAVLKWGMEGLEHAQPWVIEIRLAACNSCPHHAMAPKTLIYRGAEVVTGKDAKICTLCHCLTNTKAAISTERCPQRDPENSKLSRWGEPFVDEPKGSWIWGEG